MVVGTGVLISIPRDGQAHYLNLRITCTLQAVSPGPRNIDSLFTPEPRNLSGSIEQPPQPVHKATFSVYKSSAAMRLVPLKPTWKAVGEMGTMTIERNGSLLMEFAKSSGTRQYNWEEKQVHES